MKIVKVHNLTILFIYKINKTIIIDNTDYYDYGEGIYFFLNKQKAIEYSDFKIKH